MRYLARVFFIIVCAVAVSTSLGQERQKKPLPSFDFEATRAHELNPHRHSIRLQGFEGGFNQIQLKLTVSPNGEVVAVIPNAEPAILKFWAQVQSEVLNWKFAPFEVDGKPVTAEVEDYFSLVPAERLPKTHVVPPAIHANSEVAITLQRTGCFGTCPAYTVTVSTEGITFEGRAFVVASGTHTDSVNTDEVRALAKRFVAADFYSMEAAYRALITDCPTYILSISIDGHKKEVEDYVGEQEGMPTVISELENAIDDIARTDRWIEGHSGLVPALRAEEFKFGSFAAQLMLKEASTRGQSETVRGLLDSGVPLEHLLPPKSEGSEAYVPMNHVGWLSAAAHNPETLSILISAGASKSDQSDKDLALVGAARSGKVDAARALIAYGANPNADLSKGVVTEGDTITMEGPGAGSILIYAAESGNPDMVREILRYHPKMDARDKDGKTALSAAAEYHYGDKEGTRVECVRLLVQAGADVNARDHNGNTALHETFLTDVEEALLELGADVNARNNEGETPIFTNVDNRSIALFISHGADLTVRNNKEQTVFQAADERGSDRVEALRRAIQDLHR